MAGFALDHAASLAQIGMAGKTPKLWRLEAGKSSITSRQPPTVAVGA